MDALCWHWHSAANTGICIWNVPGSVYRSINACLVSEVLGQVTVHLACSGRGCMCVLSMATAQDAWCYAAWVTRCRAGGGGGGDSGGSGGGSSASGPPGSDMDITAAELVNRLSFHVSMLGRAYHPVVAVPSMYVLCVCMRKCVGQGVLMMCCMDTRMYAWRVLAARSQRMWIFCFFPNTNTSARPEETEQLMHAMCWGAEVQACMSL